MQSQVAGCKSQVKLRKCIWRLPPATCKPDFHLCFLYLCLLSVVLPISGLFTKQPINHELFIIAFFSFASFNASFRGMEKSQSGFAHLAALLLAFTRTLPH